MTFCVPGSNVEFFISFSCRVSLPPSICGSASLRLFLFFVTSILLKYFVVVFLEWPSIWFCYVFFCLIEDNAVCLITGDTDLDPMVPARFHHCNDTYCLSLVISKYLGDYTLRFCIEISCFSLMFTHQLAFLDGSCLQQLLNGDFHFCGSFSIH